MRNMQQLILNDSSGTVSSSNREGSILILTCVCLMALLAATALSVDVGYITMQKSRMQNAVDAAALAAAQEITNAVRNAPANTQDPTAYALGQARITASYVAGLSGIYVNANTDVTFGQRQYNSSTKTWSTTWNASPANTVKVVARRTADDASAQDGKLRLFFGGAIGSSFAAVQTEAVAFVQARDIAVVHDFSRSMNFDSHFPLNSEQITRMADSQVVANMELCWNDLQPINVGSLVFTPKYLTLTGTSSGTSNSCKFMYDDCYVTSSKPISKVVVKYTNGSSTTKNYSGNVTTATIDGSRDISSVSITAQKTSGSGSVTQTFTDSTANIKTAFGLNGSYPFPGGSWNSFVDHCKNDEQVIARGYREMYGGLTFINYTFRTNSSYDATPKLCKARHYPFSAIKSGHQQLCNFLQTLAFDDRIGMVSYDTSHRIEKVVNDPNDATIPYVNISSNPLSGDYTAVNNLMKYKQANYYSPSTNMGGGLSDGIALLDDYTRAGAQPTILLMTDGNSNVTDRNVSTSLPSGWDWDTLFDYDGDGAKDYTTSDSQKRYVLQQAYSAVQKGYVIHTICVGADADTELLKAVAWLGGGLAIVVPATSTSAEMEAQLLVAFQQIASMVPPAKLLNSEGT